jgi:DUF4097 and DUF4098 domain-containing protein YvlB
VLNNLEHLEVQRQAQADARKEEARARAEGDKAIREAQREIRRAQLEVQRELMRQQREHMHRESRPRPGRGRFTGRENKTFTISGTARVKVTTFDGPVTVRGWDKPEVMYTITKRAADEQSLKNPVVKAEQQGNTISIISGADSGASANLEIFLPRNVSLNITTSEGRLSVDGVGGDLTLRTAEGPIDVANGKGTLKVNTDDGAIKIAGFEGLLDARTGDGPITLQGKFMSLAARTGAGSVVLTVPHDANFTVESNAEKLTNVGLTVTEDLAPSGRVKRWKVNKGGKVFVISTGSGNILLRSQ